MACLPVCENIFLGLLSGTMVKASAVFSRLQIQFLAKPQSSMAGSLGERNWSHNWYDTSQFGHKQSLLTVICCRNGGMSQLYVVNKSEDLRADLWLLGMKRTSWQIKWTLCEYHRGTELFWKRNRIWWQFFSTASICAKCSTTNDMNRWVRTFKPTSPLNYIQFTLWQFR